MTTCWRGRLECSGGKVRIVQERGFSVDVKCPRRDRDRLHWHGAAASALALLLIYAGPGSAAEELRIGGTGSGLGTMQVLSEAFARQNPGVKSSVLPSLGTSGGLKALAKQAIDVAVISRPLKDDERKQGLTSHEYGRTPFVFAVSSGSPASETTLAQMADIYAGRMKNWPGGSGVRVVLRPVGDGDTDLVKSLSPAMKQAVSEAEKRPGVPFAVNDQEAADDIGKIPGAVGPTTLALVVSEKRPLKPLKLDGVEPTVKNAAAGAYPHHKRMFLVTGAKPSAAAQRFVAFVQSPAGRQILERNGHWVP